MSHLTGAGLTVVIRVGEARVVLERLPQELTHCTTHSTPRQSLQQVSHTVELTHRTTQHTTAVTSTGQS